MDESTTPGASGSESADDRLRKLALALLAPRFSAESGIEPQLLAGELPPNLPFEVPLPEGARVLGTLVGGEPTIAVETPLEPGDAVEFYRTALTAGGWREEAMPGVHRGGFVHSAANLPTMATFGRSEEGPSLRIMYFAALGGGTTIQIHIATQPAESVNARQHHMTHRDYMSVLPAIFPPPRSMQQGSGGSAGPDHVSAQAQLESELDIPTLAAHYRGQLERAGWQAVESGESGPVAWSAWTFSDDEGEPWRATFVALQQVGQPGRYHLWLSADYAGGNAGGSPGRHIGTQTHATGWTTYGSISSR